MILAKSVLHTPNTPRDFPDAVTAAAAAVSIYSGLRSRRNGTEKQEKLHIVMRDNASTTLETVSYETSHVGQGGGVRFVSSVWDRKAIDIG